MPFGTEPRAKQHQAVESSGWRARPDSGRGRFPPIVAVHRQSPPGPSRLRRAVIAVAENVCLPMPYEPPIERLHVEIRHRTNVVGIFPNKDAITQWVGPVLLEQNDERVVQEDT